jgi:hypothetical protein
MNNVQATLVELKINIERAASTTLVSKALPQALGARLAQRKQRRACQTLQRYSLASELTKYF